MFGFDDSLLITNSVRPNSAPPLGTRHGLTLINFPQSESITIAAECLRPGRVPAVRSACLRCRCSPGPVWRSLMVETTTGAGFLPAAKLKLQRGRYPYLSYHLIGRLYGRYCSTRTVSFFSFWIDSCEPRGRPLREIRRKQSFLATIASLCHVMRHSNMIGGKK